MPAQEEKFSEFVDRYLIVKDAKCYRHCQQNAKFTPLRTDHPGVIGGYACPGNYVSRVVYFSLQPDQAWFETFLRGQVGDLLRSRDLRVATRHGWELGGKAESEIKQVSSDGIRQIYWTLYPVSESEKTSGPFRCENCGSLFVKSFSDDADLCTKCRA